MRSIDPQLVAAARESANFGDLAPIEPLLAIYAAGAESGVYTDPNGALIKCRQFGEVLAEQLIRPVREAQQIADCVERKPKLARVADERQSILCRLPVEPLVAGASLWRRQKPDLLIVADRGNLHPGCFAQLSDSEHQISPQLSSY